MSIVAQADAIALPSMMPARSTIDGFARRSGRFISASSAIDDRYGSRHPRAPHQHGRPSMSTVMCASDPKLPCAPEKRTPSTMHAESRVASAISKTKLGVVIASPTRRSASTAAAPAVAMMTRRSVSSSRCSRNGKLFHPGTYGGDTVPACSSTGPTQLTPTAENGGTDSRAAALTRRTRRSSARHTSRDGIVTRSRTCIVPSGPTRAAASREGSTTTARTGGAGTATA